MAQTLEVPGLLSLAVGFVDQETLPNDDLARLVHDLLADPKKGPAALQYGTTAGSEPLRQSLLDRTKLLYRMTYSQNPTGATLTAQRRPQVWDVFPERSVLSPAEILTVEVGVRCASATPIQRTTISQRRGAGSLVPCADRSDSVATRYGSGGR